METPVVEVFNLTKKFGKLVAVDDISFVIKRGEILGFLGPNGAGKTTTINMLLGLIKPTKGEIRIFGKDLAAHREEILQRVGFSSAYNTMRGRLTPFENLYVFAHIFGIGNKKEKILELLEMFDLSHFKDKETMSLSSGEMTRLNLCRTLLNDPDLLLLDEPTASLDPDVADKTHEILFKIRRARNLSILYTSHNMEEISKMCDRIVFLSHGKIVASDTPLNLTKMIKECTLSLIFDAPLKKMQEFGEKEELNFTIPKPHTLEIKLEEEEIANILTKLVKSEIQVTEIDIEKPDLEDVFLKIARENQGAKNEVA